MNNFKKTGGFTLVELIVVIAILGILAAVAIPAYSGYIKKANDAAVITKLDAIATAAQAANAKVGEISEIKVDDDGTTVTVTGAAELASDFETNFKMFYADATSADINDADKKECTIVVPDLGLDKTETYKNGATWTKTSGAWS